MPQCEEDGGVHSHSRHSAINKPTTDYSLSIANRLYGANSFHFLQQYLRCTETLYHAELEVVDFSSALEETRRKINSWVENQTNGKIQELFPPDSISHDAALVLVNAIYFKGNWTVKFKKGNTKETVFRLNKNETKNVQMMFQNGIYNLAIIEEPQVDMLELPYGKTEELSMLIFLPKDIKDNSTGLEQLESAFTYTKLEEWTSLAKKNKQNVDVYLPRFKIEENYDLENVLKAMGMLDLFDHLKADLSGMSGEPNLIVSKVIHKSYVDINEEGTEATGATGGVAVPVSMPIPHEFKANHPFLFFIKDNVPNSILFCGRCASP
ncbi:leukocyte elastase inhibitor [Alligator mississippiensis]|nr:leukocyte elastase inhibitor [Alligator mississippiensis]